MTVFSHGYYARSDDASFIIVSGAETIEFLQSILTANIATMPIGGCRPAALLTPQGRILIDMMVYRPSDAEVYLQTDNARPADLLARLRRYRLRRLVNLELGDDMQLTVWWGYVGTTAPEDPSIFPDPRHADLGCRIVSSGVSSGTDLPPALDTAKAVSYDSWHARRIAQAIPEGAVDLQPERALMLEAGLDKLAAVDFEKGCYIGQEVTARTHYRGLVKRRLIPMLCDGPPPAPGRDIIWQGKTIGTSKTAAPAPADAGQSVLLALLKLEDIHAILAAADAQPEINLTVNGLLAKLCPPTWCLPLPVPAAKPTLG
jgi:folate-binding protein YgfZ